MCHFLQDCLKILRKSSYCLHFCVFDRRTSLLICYPTIFIDDIHLCTMYTLNIILSNLQFHIQKVTCTHHIQDVRGLNSFERTFKTDPTVLPSTQSQQMSLLR